MYNKNKTMTIPIVVFVFLVAYWILLQPGELLQKWAFWCEMNLPTWLNKLVTCPYCLGGQIVLWWAVYWSISEGNIYRFVYVPIYIIVTFVFITFLRKITE